MRRTPATGRLERGRAGRIGRPTRRLAALVEGRILQAARQVFLEHGLAGATMEQVAGLAGAGKPTVYARFPSKEALFAAVVMRNVSANIARFESLVPTGGTIDERLANMAANILHWALVSDIVGLMRLAIAEAPRFPDLATSVHRMTRERGTAAVARLLGDLAQSDELGRLPAFASERIATTTRFFLDLVLLPLLMRALFGEKLKPLHAEIGPHVSRSVAFFLAACRQGRVT
jgi:AcrR family transcriptional regulator